MAKFGNLNPAVITDDMMYEDSVWAEPTAELESWAEEYVQHMNEELLWKDIRKVAETNSTLQSALEECIIIYKLAKEYKNGI